MIEAEEDSTEIQTHRCSSIDKTNEAHNELRSQSVASDASRFLPDPADASSRRSVLRSIAGYILVTEFCERLAYYGFAGSLVLFFQTQLGLSNAEADVQYSAWSGVCYVTPLLGGYLADTYLGRYATILIFCTIYLVGLVMVVIGSVPGDINAPFFFAAIYIIALGTGGIKPNVSTLGADQFDTRYSADRKELLSFFNWFYWAVNLGALLAYSVVAYLCQYGIPSAGGTEWGFFWGYLIPAASMFAGITVFVVGSSNYTLRPPAGSVLSLAGSVVFEAFVTRANLPRPPSRLHKPLPDGAASVTSAPVNGALEPLIVDSSADGSTNVVTTPLVGGGDNANAVRFDPVVGSTTSDGSDGAVMIGTGQGHLLDKASVEFGGTFSDRAVRGVKSVVRLMPFLLVLIPFWGIYSQMSTAFQNQACQMDLRLAEGVEIPVAALNAFDTVTVLILVPLFDTYLYPKLQIMRGGRAVSLLEKMGAGFVLAALAMCVAALVEQQRLHYAPAPVYLANGTTSDMTPCQSSRDYDPYSFQSYMAGTDDDHSAGAPLYCSQTCDRLQQNSTLLALSCISCDPVPQMSGLSVFWQVPQFALIGAAEILSAISALEFFYSQAPAAMRSVTQSLNLFTISLGSFLVIPLLILVNNMQPGHPWVPANLDSGSLGMYFLLLGGLMLCTLVVFWRLARGYEYADPAELQLLEQVPELQSSQFPGGAQKFGTPGRLGALLRSLGLERSKREAQDEIEDESSSPSVLSLLHDPNSSGNNISTAAITNGNTTETSAESQEIGDGLAMRDSGMFHRKSTHSSVDGSGV